MKPLPVWTPGSPTGLACKLQQQSRALPLGPPMRIHPCCEGATYQLTFVPLCFRVRLWGCPFWLGVKGKHMGWGFPHPDLRSKTPWLQLVATRGMHWSGCIHSAERPRRRHQLRSRKHASAVQGLAHASITCKARDSSHEAAMNESMGICTNKCNMLPTRRNCHKLTQFTTFVHCHCPLRPPISYPRLGLAPFPQDEKWLVLADADYNEVRVIKLQNALLS